MGFYKFAITKDLDDLDDDYDSPEDIQRAYEEMCECDNCMCQFKLEDSFDAVRNLNWDIEYEDVTTNEVLCPDCIVERANEKFPEM